MKFVLLLLLLTNKKVSQILKAGEVVKLHIMYSYCVFKLAQIFTVQVHEMRVIKQNLISNSDSPSIVLK